MLLRHFVSLFNAEAEVNTIDLTLKAPITTAADDKFCDIFPIFDKNKVCQQTILMKYHALLVIFEKAAKFEIVVCCTLYRWRFKGDKSNKMSVRKAKTQISLGVRPV